MVCVRHRDVLKQILVETISAKTDELTTRDRQLMFTTKYGRNKMGKKVVVGLGTLAAILEGVSPGLIPGGGLLLALVVLGLVWGWMGVDANEPTTYCALAIAVGMTGSSDALSHLPAVGDFLDAIVGATSVALYSGVATVLGVRIYNRLTG